VYRIFGFGIEWSGGGLVLAMRVRCPAIYRHLLASCPAVPGHSLASRFNYTQSYSICVAKILYVLFHIKSVAVVIYCPHYKRCHCAVTGTGTWRSPIGFRRTNPLQLNHLECSLNIPVNFKTSGKKCWQSWYIRMHKQIAAFCVRSDMQLTVHERGL
jgi:hypothetical protein